MKDAYYVYMLVCGDNSLYTGITNDLEKRVVTHNRGDGGHYTASRLPVELVYYEKHPDKSSALKRELAIKALKRKDKLALISDWVK